MTPLSEMLVSLWLIVVVGVLALPIFRAWKKRQQMVRHINQFPGPRFSLPILGDLHRLLGDPNKILEYAKKVWYPHAPRMHLWAGHIPIVGLGHPDDLETILSNNDHNTKAHVVYRLVENFFGRGLLTLNGVEWRAHRKAITPSFHFSMLESYVDIFFERAEALQQRIRDLGDNADVSLLPLVGGISNETICETAFGWQASKESKAEREEFIEDMETAFNIIQYRFLHPWFLIDSVFGLTKMAKKHRLAESKIQNYAKRAIFLRKQALASKKQTEFQGEDACGVRQRHAFLDLMLIKDNGLTEDDILGEVRTLIAVQETSATTLCFALLMLAMHPDIQQQVLEEVEHVWSQTDLTPLQKLNSLNLQERVFKETLRLFPPVPAIAREATSDIELSGGKTIPQGAIIALPVFFTHRDPTFFAEPEIFDPDRFLPENCVGRHPYAFVPFSAGSRNCIGQKYALLQMKAVMSTLVRRLKFNLPDGAATKVSDLQMTVDTFLKLVGGWRVRTEHRRRSSFGSRSRPTSRRSVSNSANQTVPVLSSYFGAKQSC